MSLRHQFWFGNVPFLFLPCRAHLVSFGGDSGSPRVFVTTLWKREARAMKVVVIEKRKGFVGMLLRKFYGIRKIEEV